MIKVVTIQKLQYLILPVNKCTLGVHQIKLVIKSCPGLSNGSGVGEHTDAPRHLCQVSSRNHSWWLVVDTNLESCWTPVNKLDGSLGLDGGNGSIDILGDHISPVEHAAGHVLAMTRITLDHLVGWLETSVGDLWYSQLFMISLLCRDDWSINSQREVNPKLVILFITREIWFKVDVCDNNIACSKKVRLPFNQLAMRVKNNFQLICINNGVKCILDKMQSINF